MAKIKQSNVFRKFLKSTLIVGNFMMAGTNQGNASGFKLNFLTKLVEIKSNVPRLNILHIIVKDIPNEQVITN